MPSIGSITVVAMSAEPFWTVVGLLWLAGWVVALWLLAKQKREARRDAARLAAEREAEQAEHEAEQAEQRAEWERRKAQERAERQDKAKAEIAFIKAHEARKASAILMRQELRARNLSEHPLDEWLETYSLWITWDEAEWDAWAHEMDGWDDAEWAEYWDETPPSEDDDDGPSYWATGTYDPDRYGAAVREYGHSHMDYIHQAYGDLDTYESNRPY